MIIRDYVPADEQSWLRCRVVSFLDCSYYRDVKTRKEVYGEPSIGLVAEDEGQIIGLIDIELDSEDLMYKDHGRGAVLWHMAVLPEYRRQGVAAALWKEAQKRLIDAGVRYCEVWTQEDEAANRFYQSMGFELKKENTWIRCCASWDKAYDLLDKEKIGEVYGAEEIVFQAALQRKEELQSVCSRMDEVRLYTRVLYDYYRPCRELDICNELMETYWNTQQYDKCFEGHLALAKQGYPLAECQIGYFYYEGLGIRKDMEKALYWIRRAAEHGDRDGQCNLAWFYEDGIGVERDPEEAKYWYRQAALQNHDLALEKCRELGISLETCGELDVSRERYEDTGVGLEECRDTDVRLEG